MYVIFLYEITTYEKILIKFQSITQVGPFRKNNFFYIYKKFYFIKKKKMQIQSSFTFYI